MSQPGSGTASSPSILSSSAVMAAGTVVSRLSGFARGALLAAALGVQLHADVFNIANTIPNMLYILLAGGVFNAVLVPQLVRAMKHDEDGGEGYTSRVITLAALFLAGVTAVLVIAAPLLMQLFLSSSFADPALAAQRDSAVDFARYCLPQVFFYGMFVLVGQVLNSRGSFGPMMWAPIANNVISVAVLGVYLATFGPAVDVCRGGVAASPTDSVLGPFSPGQTALLGLGSTLGIAVQLLILVPYLRRAGFRYRPRFDFRGTGLGHTLRLGVWTVLFVIVNQVAYTVVVRIASSGTAAAAGSCASRGATGYTVYSSAFLLVMVPHAIATVSLATAMLPRLSAYAADKDLAALGRGVGSTLRTSYALIVPFALLLPVIAVDVANVIYGYGAARELVRAVRADAVAVRGRAGVLHQPLPGAARVLRTRAHPARVLDPVRGERRQHRAGLGADPRDRAGRHLTAAGARLHRGLRRRRAGVVRGAQPDRRRPRGGHAGAVPGPRLLPSAAVAAGAAWLASQGLHDVLPGAGKVVAVATLAAAGVVDLVVFGVLARLLRITEVTEVFALVTRRVPTRRRGN